MGQNGKPPPHSRRLLHAHGSMSTMDTPTAHMARLVTSKCLALAAHATCSRTDSNHKWWQTEILIPQRPLHTM